MKDFNKVLRLGVLDGHSIFSKVEFKGGKLSVTGVHGPYSNGNAFGSCGQLVMTFKQFDARGYYSVTQIRPAPGWDAASIARFFEVWDLWHLNDMRAGCQHQRASWNISEEIELIHYGLTMEAHRERDEAKRIAAAAAVAGTVAQLTKQQHALLALTRWYADVFTPPDADSPLSGCYEVKKREKKAAGWLSHSEHPRGLLGKPCTVCGYKYGSAWLREDVPADVLEWLAALPDTDQKPAWV